MEAESKVQHILDCWVGGLYASLKSQTFCGWYIQGCMSTFLPWVLNYQAIVTWFVELIRGEGQKVLKHSKRGSVACLVLIEAISWLDS